MSTPTMADALTVKHGRVPSRLDGVMIRLLRNPRFWIWLVVTPAVLSGVLFAYPGGPLMAFQDVCDAKSCQETIRATESDGVRMQNELVVLHDRLQRKEELLDAWVDYRLTFRVVCENFAELNAACPSALRIQRDQYGHNVNELELGALNLVMFIEQRCQNSEIPYRLKQRMNEDYMAMFGHRPLRLR